MFLLWYFPTSPCILRRRNLATSEKKNRKSHSLYEAITEGSGTIKARSRSWSERIKNLQKSLSPKRLRHKKSHFPQRIYKNVFFFSLPGSLSSPRHFPPFSVDSGGVKVITQLYFIASRRRLLSFGQFLLLKFMRIPPVMAGNENLE